MRFNFKFFERQGDAHIRKSREYLEDAHVGRVEHQAAAEHHSALAKMYAERIVRIEAEINEALQRRSLNPEISEAPELRSLNVQSVETAGERDTRLKSDSVVIYPSRASHA